MLNGKNKFGPLAPGQQWVLAGVIVCSIMLGWAAVRSRGSTPPEHLITDRPIQVRTDGYTSSQACGACHPAQYATWHGSFHRTMTQLATRETVRADFDGV